MICLTDSNEKLKRNKMRNGNSILALYEGAALSVKEWHDLTIDMVGRCETPEDAQRLHQQFELAEIAARVSNDAALETNFREGKLRLKIFLGLWSRGLEKAEKVGGAGKFKVPISGKIKEEQLSEAGIGTSRAHRYEELAGPKDEQAKGIATEAQELYLAQQRQKQQPGTMAGLVKAVKTAVVSALGPPASKPKTKPPELSREDRASMDWNAWIMDIDGLEPELAAEGEDKEFAQEEVNSSHKALLLIERYQIRMKEKFNVIPKK